MRSGWIRGRRGASAVEVLVVLLLTAALAQGAWAVMAAQRRSAELLMRRGESLAGERIVRSVLRAETSAGRPDLDWRISADDVLSLRAFRAWGVPCPIASAGGDLLVRVRGMRKPDPGKDSLLVLGSDGEWLVGTLDDRRSTDERCPGVTSTPLEEWTVSTEARDGVLFRVFESGSYHLEDATFRYRRGRAGRQPLTPPVLDPSASGFEELADGGVGLRIVLDGAGPAADGWGRRLRGNGGGRLP